MVFFSGLNNIIKHFGANIQKISPKLEARMANISTATVNLPGELRYAGINVIQTAQKISILKVISLASLKLSGSFLARTAKTKQNRAKSPMYPSTTQNPMAEPRAHSRMIRSLYAVRFFIGKGGLTTNQMVQIKIWTKVKEPTVILC